MNITLLRIIFLVILISAPPSLNCRAETYDTRTKAIDPRFRTIQWRLNGDDQILPVVTLDGNEVLTLTFDELTDTRSYLRYELIHCNRFWQPDGLVDSEFLDGFNQAEVTDYAYSLATLAHYVNYSITIPNADMRPLISGNYLLRVYEESNPDDTLLQARFSVNEATMRIAAGVTSRTDIDYQGSHQQLDVTVDTDRIPVRDITRDLTMTVTQNGRLDNIRTVTTPLRTDATHAYYLHNRNLIFPAGNEYRRFETISTQYPGMHIDRITRTGQVYGMILTPDDIRAAKKYSYDQTQNGRFRIRNYNADDSDTEADYTAVTFELDAPEFTDGDIFIDGDLTGRILGPESRMIFDRASNTYRLTMYLKQGSYNYQYLFVPYGSEVGQTGRIEGDFWPTVNRYDIMVYHTVPGERYDRLVAVGSLYADH